MKQKMKNAEQVAELLKIIAHPIRLMVICLLREREYYALEIQEALGTTKGNISQHMKILLMNKIIGKRHEANRTYFSLKDKNLHKLIETMEKIYCSCKE